MDNTYGAVDVEAGQYLYDEAVAVQPKVASPNMWRRLGLATVIAVAAFSGGAVVSSRTSSSTALYQAPTGENPIYEEHDIASDAKEEADAEAPLSPEPSTPTDIPYDQVMHVNAQEKHTSSLHHTHNLC